MTLTIPGCGLVVDLDVADAIHLRDELTAALARELPGGALVDDEDLRGCERMPHLKPGDVEGWSIPSIHGGER